MKPIVCLLAIWLPLATLRGQEFTERFDDWPLETTLGGRIVMVPHVEQLELTTAWLEADAKRLACIADDALGSQIVGWLESSYDERPDCSNAIGLDDQLLDEVEVLIHARPAELANRAHLRRLARFVGDGNTLLAVGESARRMGEWVGQITDEGFELTPGTGLVPKCLLMLDFDGQRRELLGGLAAVSRGVGLGVDPGCVVMIDGRKLYVAGRGQAHLLVAGSDHHEAVQASIGAFDEAEWRRPERWMADWTQWRRRAIERTLEAFPGAEVEVPHVPRGALFIVGGGGMPDGLMDRFIEAAGGLGAARLVYIPCSEEPTIDTEPSIVRQWRRAGVQDATFIHTKDRRQADQDEALLGPLRRATGIWFGGGRQWNFSDSYYGTTAHRLMKEVLQRGGVVGGSSAGASIQAAYLARATPIQNLEIMAPGYERGGLGFIRGVAIDQHFTQRKRQADMQRLIACYPQLLGIGIDEGTALIVHQSIAEVVGDGDVYFYDVATHPSPLVLSSGQRYHLEKRTHALTEQERRASPPAALKPEP